MSYMGNLKKGDRVRVAIEAEVKYGSSFGVDLAVGNGCVTIREESFSGVEFEKIEPPVEVFKPGDVVRNGGDGRVVIAITRDGYTYVGPVNRGLTVTRKDRIAPGFKEFTSRDFERVNLDSLA